MLKLTIGKLNIRLDGVEAGQVPENTLLFRSDFQEADLEYTFRLGENPAVGAYPVVYRAKDIVVFGKPGGLEARLLYMPDSHICYAYYEEISDRKINVYINGAYREHLRIDTIFISLLALERHEARREAFILHCAYMDFGGKAILFSGPSGIGKSTHSGLWCAEYPDKARVLNGDKCLLTREDDGRIFANGWPVCGSSGICHNEKREVAGIVLLQQHTGFVSLDPATYYVSTAPMELNAPLIILLNAATLLISTFVLIAPSYLVSHIHPAKSMRYE